MALLPEDGNSITALGGLLIFIGSGIAVYGAWKAGREAADNDDALIEAQTATLRFVTGGNSFVYFEPQDFGSPTARLMLHVEGDYPVRDLDLSIYDVSDQHPSIAGNDAGAWDFVSSAEKIDRQDNRIAVSYPGGSGQKSLRRYPLPKSPDRDFYYFVFYMMANSGNFRQEIAFRRTDEGWRYAYRVVQEAEEDNEEGYKYVHRKHYVQPGYPDASDVLFFADDVKIVEID